MIYIIDHQDSFTFNLVHLLSKFDEVYVSNYFDINYRKLSKSNLVVFSPGPGEPKDYPITSDIYNRFKSKKKLLGICLGFQQILFNEKGKICQQKKIYHGHQSKIIVLKNSKLFKHKTIYTVGRYHSLKLFEPYYSDQIKITMRCTTTKVAMAFEDNINKVYGFQFHPESFLTKNGKNIIQKIIFA
ncbi:MAG: Anthranilate synthase component 2 [Alphaproteobacteria bacterium MarineAlpha5_Bin9]|nr:MAG: Anthranilate synthase component 2 [Alphaproteobacteria bacterium MarineAlpha5_Bin9]|tara:strand:+ start:35617 stop:36174 length:558 start_codon:yes stop_codon:yes gene_type:complete